MINQTLGRRFYTMILIMLLAVASASCTVAAPPDQASATQPVAPLSPQVVEPTTLQATALAQSPRILWRSWSPDGAMLAYWTFSAEEVARDYLLPPGALHFLDMRTGQSCPYPYPVRYGYFGSSLAWTPDGDVLTIDDEYQMRLSAPCGDRHQDVMDWFPVQVSSIASQSADKRHALLSDEQGYALFDLDTQAYRPLDVASPNLAGDGYSWSPDNRYLGIANLIDVINGFTVRLYVFDVASGDTVVSMQYRHRDGKGNVGGPLWLNTEQLLIRETLDRGPLLVTLGEQLRVQEIMTELFHTTVNGMPFATAASVGDDGVFHIVLSSFSYGEPVLEPSPVFVYHSDTGSVEELPFFDLIGLSPDGKWLLISRPADPQWPACIYLQATARSDTRTCLLPDANSAQASWTADSTHVAFTYANTVYVYAVADGRLVATWEPGESQVGPPYWTPDGRALLVSALQRQGQEQEQTLFRLDLPR